MKWGKKQQKNPIKQEDVHVINKPPSSSTFSLSNLLPFSSWFSKLKPPPKPNNNPNPTTAPAPAPAPAPTPKPLFSPPPLPPTRTHSDVTTAPRRLSIGDDDSHLTCSRTHSLPHLRHHSLGPELDILLDLTRSRRTRRRRRHPDPKPIKTGPDPDPIQTGRRSFSSRRIRPKVRVHSPRLSNPNPTAKERGLERFAVVKRSSDPVRDFRESMVEMIWERGIGRPEELESLLACYLSLNSDEHHDVIVKVFRQVWFDLNREMDRVRVSVL